MTLADAICERCVKLPDEAAREALDFIDFLGQRYGTTEIAANGDDAAGYEGCSRPRCNGRWTIRVPESTMIKFASTLPTAAKPCARNLLQPAKTGPLLLA